MTEHTKGPWEIRRALHPVDGEFDYAIGAELDGKRYCIAEAFARVGDNVRPDAAANARLIASAPDMLAALRDAMDFMEERINRELGGETPDAREAAVIESARAAIQRATAKE